ncbi:MAG: 2-oxo acid dehydrogenase subunit E2 [Acidobacteria bacterium]|nr:2-oxo acid dehydrogenase subunit E2 [Acidobacteriota bacterium]
MPQMGESVAEGTIVRWIKRVGDAVEKDEPLFEISTDKVDAEIPSPDAGVVLEIRVAEGETVPVHSVVAVIGTEGQRVPPAMSTAPGARSAPVPPPAETSGAGAGAPGATVSLLTAAPLRAVSADDRLRTRSSPVVRKIAQARGIDIGQLTGTGIRGRVTRRDIEAYIERGRTRARPSLPPAYQPGDNVRLEKMSVMRRKIAEHMLASVQTAPHVYSAFEVDFSRVDALRAARRAEYESAGTRLTYTAFIARATVEALRECPWANASVDGETIVYKHDIHLGIAVALEQGLIVPVIRHADRLSMMELCRAIQDLAARARAKQLKVDDVQNGTFTITNPGVFGAVFGLPIINQPQVAILGVGTVDKRAVVVDDAVAVRPMCYLTLGHDHRLIDGAEGARFLQTIKSRIEGFDASQL